jgi:UrcA family protein
MNYLLNKTGGPIFLVLLGTMGTAGAQSPNPTAINTDTLKVSLGALNLSTPQGMREAHERARRAARRVCAKVANSADMQTKLRYITCIDEAMDRALARIDEVAHRMLGQRLAHTSTAP